MNIFLITDYKGHFGSKYNDSPYRSGFSKDLLVYFFGNHNYTPKFLNPSESNLKDLKLSDEIVLYTSQEDNCLYYKSFLEDFLYYLTLQGAKIIPSFPLLKAHENKVFFEMLKAKINSPILNNLKSNWFGTFEDFLSQSDNFTYPVVIKTFHGSMSRGVHLAKTRKDALKKVKRFSHTQNLYLKIWDSIRALKHNGYIKESWNRKKYIIQEYLPGLTFDFKILIYGHKYYVIRREINPGDFRASGQGKLTFIRELPNGLLDFAKKCFNLFKTPQASFDIAFDGNLFYLLEAQFVYFGTYTIENSSFYFTREYNKWSCIEQKSVLEEEYVCSTIQFLQDESSFCV